VSAAVGAPFRAFLDGMPDLGQGAGWTRRQWRKAPPCRVRLQDLVATNRGGYLDENRIQHYMRGGSREPYVVEHAGCLYVADGHHRATAAHRRGSTHIRARVMVMTS
jgi:hypothetical protein